MDAFTGTTIAALCYRRETAVDVQRLAAQLSQAIANTEGSQLDLPTEDFALCEAPDMRIGLAQVALDHAFPGCLTGRHYPSCIVLSVGPGTRVPEAQAVARYARVHADLVSRVQDVAPADRILLFERPGPYDRDLHDIVVDDIRSHLDSLLASQRAPVADVERSAPFAHAVTPVSATARAGPRAVVASQPDDIIQGLANRLEAELDRLEETRRALEVAGAATGSARTVRRRTPRDWRQVVAQLVPDRPAATFGLFAAPAPRARQAGGDDAYPDDAHRPANVDERPLLHRAAVNALNASVMTIALPVGAALVTMAVLGREDMLVSSRVTAITGVGVALHNTGVIERLFTMIS